MSWRYFSCVLLTLTVSASTSAHRSKNGISESVSGDGGRHRDDGWDAFVARYDKTYNNAKEESKRRIIRNRHLSSIATHNKAAASGKHSYTLKENDRIDWTDREFGRLLGFVSRRTTTSGSRIRRQTYNYPSTYSNTVDVSTLPSCVDWTKIGWVGPVMNQGPCGSCWAYSATGALQSQYYNYSGQMVQMSQQNLIDCSTPQGNLGCNGGFMQSAFWYVQKNGIESLDTYPDVSNKTGLSNQPCDFKANLSVTSIASWSDIDSGSESALQQAVALVGPMSAAIDASSESFWYYGGGVYSNPNCSLNAIDHAILVVGYGVYNGQSYWLIQNSWGTDWGINGYMMLARNSDNMCGIATDATFPIIDSLQSSTATPNIIESDSSSSTDTAIHDSSSDISISNTTPSNSLITTASFDFYSPSTENTETTNTEKNTGNSEAISTTAPGASITITDPYSSFTNTDQTNTEENNNSNGKSSSTTVPGASTTDFERFLSTLNTVNRGSSTISVAASAACTFHVHVPVFATFTMLLGVIIREISGHSLFAFSSFMCETNFNRLSF